MGATSAGLPARSSGALSPCFWTFSFPNDCGMSGVQIGPGATPLTLMPRFVSYFASPCVNVRIAPFVTA